MVKNVIYALEDVNELPTAQFKNVGLYDFFSYNDGDSSSLYIKVSNSDGNNSVLIDEKINGVAEFSPEVEVIPRKCVVTIFWGAYE